MGDLTFKDFYDVVLKASFPFDIGNRHFEEGEVLAEFDSIQIAGFDEKKVITTARGGYMNGPRVFWDDTEALDLAFTQGVFSRVQFSLLNNCKLIESGEETEIPVHIREELSVEDGKVILKEKPIPSTLFVYDEEGFIKIEDYTLEEKEISNLTCLDVICDYSYGYTNGSSLFKIGSKLLNGFVSLEGKTRIKDDVTGKLITGILKVPKLQLTSGLSMRLGEDANPIVAAYRGTALPVGSRGNTFVSEFFFLNDYIDSDF